MKYTAEIAAENARRISRAQDVPYDPVQGDPADPSRVPVTLSWSAGRLWLPATMVADPDYRRITSLLDYKRLRFRHDFEFWAVECVVIRDKLTGRQVPFRLNAPQRRVARMLDADRREGRPLRLIMLKARQWGGSTLVQMYFAWIQIVHRRNWNSLICAHVRDTAAAIRGMYDDMLAHYPEALWEGDEPPRFTPWQKSVNTREIAGRGCKVTLSSSYGQDSARGLDFSMAHLSEVAFWKDSDRMTPGDFIRSVCGGIPMVPCSVIVMESTANGVGNYFHTQWMLAERQTSAYRAVFVPWHEIEIYRTPCPDAEALVSSFSPYEKQLWDMGLTLDMIQWYRNKRAEMASDTAMHAEYPTTPQEAFENTGYAVFANSHIERLRADCRDALPESALAAGPCRRLLDMPAGDGELKVWLKPDGEAAMMRNRYVVAVDVGGRSRHADYSAITVFDRRSPSCLDRGAVAEVAAQWRGHCDHDLLGRYAATVGRVYHTALLVIESNSLESGAEGASQFILEDLNHSYPNLYVRVARDRQDSPAETRVGFHTNRSTKAAVVTALIAAVRGARIIEHDTEACNELATYEQQPGGGFAARRGYHDDLLMTRAIAVYVIAGMPAPMDYAELRRFLKLS